MGNRKIQRHYLKGKGIAYHSIYHLLEGTSKPWTIKTNQNRRYYDANLLIGNKSYDPEIVEINLLEMKIGELQPWILDLRTMVDFCCIWRYDYPENLLSICKAIGEQRAFPARCHYQIRPDQGEMLNRYALALKNWLNDNKEPAQDDERKTTEEIFTILDTRNPLKEKLVERTYLSLINRYFDCSFFGDDPSEIPIALSPFVSHTLPEDFEHRIYLLESEIVKAMGRYAFNFLGEVGGVEPPCHFKFIRRLLILIGSIRTLKWRGYDPPVDPWFKGRRELTQLCLKALKTFLNINELPSEPLKGKEQKELFDKILSLLGKPDLLKRWLVYSLYKNIKNQTNYLGYTMKRWVEFVRIKDEQIHMLTGS